MTDGKFMMVDIFIKQEYHCFNFICFCFLISFCHALFVQCLKHASTSDIPVFDKLIQLEISFGNYSWDLLASLLQRSHKLEVLTIYKVCWVEKRILFFMLCAWIWEDLVSVLSVLRKEKLYANLEKCSFCTDHMVFLGFVVSACCFGSKFVL